MRPAPDPQAPISDADALVLRAKYPLHVPVVVRPANDTRTALALRKYKFIVHRDTPLGDFCAVVRKYVDGITPATGLFYFHEGDKSRKGRVLVPMGWTVGQLEMDAGVPEGVLYMWVAGEQTFGQGF
jgi:hypothetical protein